MNHQGTDHDHLHAAAQFISSWHASLGVGTLRAESVCCTDCRRNETATLGVLLLMGNCPGMACGQRIEREPGRLWGVAHDVVRHSH